MARSAFTLRLPEATRSAIEGLSRIEQRPVNQLVAEAVDAYLQKRRPVEQQLLVTLESLRRYREKDPDFHKAAASFVEAEISGTEDPVEGSVVGSAPSARNSAQNALDHILNA